MICTFGEEDLFMQKIRKLSTNGKDVTVIVCYDDYNPFKKLRSEIDEDQHFLFNHLRNQFAEERNITLEFAYVWDVLELLQHLTADNVNTFVFDFTFNDRSDWDKIAGYLKSFSLPNVSRCPWEVFLKFLFFILSLGFFLSSLGFWERGETF